jgi:isopentenyl diphosphate isomerase/L-lactate dehydrogenase-like FMN-dependent dehydrogenase
MAYGARAVLVGRPILWGLAVGGEAGVKFVLEMLRQEFDLAMALSGCPSLTSVTRDCWYLVRFEYPRLGSELLISGSEGARVAERN